MTPLAERYVKLVLALGQHDPDYVDAYYGPAELAEAARPEGVARGDRSREAHATCAKALRVPVPDAADELRGCAMQYLDPPARGARARASRCCSGTHSTSTRNPRRSTTPSPRCTRSGIRAVLTSSIARLPGRGTAAAALRGVPQRVRDSARSARRRVHRRRSTAAGSRTLEHIDAAAGRAVHGGVRHRQELERLQLVPGQLPQPDSGEHRPADLHRSRDRSRLSRGLSRPPRLQRAAREEPGARSRVARSSRSTRCSRRSR